VEALIALARKNDPFYVGSPCQRIQGKWFADVWSRAEFSARKNKVHTRHVHYWLVSQEKPLRTPNGKPYENLESCWNFLNEASKSARYLDLVDPAEFDDRRNPDAVINATFNVWSIYFPTSPNVSVINTGLWNLPELPEFPNLPAYVINDFKSEQRFLLEVWCEKSTMNGVLGPICESYGANLQTGVGELSITKAFEVVTERIRMARRPARIFYVVDFDPGGKSMPVAVARKIEWFLRQHPNLNVRLEQIVLTLDQVKKYRLPRIPIKDSEKRKAKFEERFGAGAVELDALEALHPGELEKIVSGSLDAYYDHTLAGRTEKVRAQLQARLGSIRDKVIAGRSEEIEQLKSRWEEIREKFAAQVAGYNADAAALFERIEDEMREQQPDLTGYPVPEARQAAENGDALFDSTREYFEQLSFYKRFQNGHRK
jgi:hypothetical protein